MTRTTGIVKSSPTEQPEMSTSNITSHLVKQVEILVAINKNIPFKYRQAFAQLIETKIDAIRTKISADQLIDDKSELLEVERFSELKGKTDSAGVASRALYLLLTEKIRDLLAKNGIAKPDPSPEYPGAVKARS